MSRLFTVSFMNETGSTFDSVCSDIGGVLALADVFEASSNVFGFQVYGDGQKLTQDMYGCNKYSKWHTDWTYAIEAWTQSRLKVA